MNPLHNSLFINQKPAYPTRLGAAHIGVGSWSVDGDSDVTEPRTRTLSWIYGGSNMSYSWYFTLVIRISGYIQVRTEVFRHLIRCTCKIMGYLVSLLEVLCLGVGTMCNA